MPNNEYKLEIGAVVNLNDVDTQIKTLAKAKKVILSAEFEKSSVDKVQKVIDDINAKAKSVGKVTLFKDDSGKTTKAMVTYVNSMNNVVKATITAGKEFKVIENVTDNIEKNLKEMERYALNAEKFLAKSQNLAQTPKVAEATKVAGQIKDAVAEGDIEKVRELNKQLNIMKSGLDVGRDGLKSWSEGMKDAIKNTIEYATSIGLIYGAMQKLREGVDYLKELDKEMTNIKLLQAEGAQSSEEVTKLSFEYNQLAKELGATTIEVAKGI